MKDGSAIAGATSATYNVPNVTAATAGNYTVTVTGAKDSITTQAATITVEPINPGRLTNLSVRTTAGTGEQTLTVGSVVSGAPDKPLLIRAIGPSLAQFGVNGTLPDPRLQLFSVEPSSPQMTIGRHRSMAEAQRRLRTRLPRQEPSHCEAIRSMRRWCVR